VTPAESPALGGEPPLEDRAASDVEALEEVAAEQGRQRSLPARRERLDALAGRPGDFERVDEAVHQVEPDGVSAGLDAPAAALVDETPDLAQAPPELSARIVRNVPEKLA
jgi:hypothetical protein